MSDLSSLLNNMYSNDSRMAQSHEKTAEDSLLAALRHEGHVEENPYASMSIDELEGILAQGDGAEKVAAALGETPELLEKTAAEMLGGQIMAHAMVDEMGLIKVAMVHGFCRVCKDAPMDIDGVSVCSGCTAASQE